MKDIEDIVRDTPNNSELGAELRKQLSETAYHLNCDICGKTFWSDEPFPIPHICPNCYIWNTILS